MTDAIALLRTHLEHTGTACHPLAHRDDIAPFLERVLGEMRVRTVMVFPEEIPGGEELAGRWRGGATEKLPFAVLFAPADLPPEATGLAGFMAGLDACVTGCRALVAEGGICVFDSAAPSGRLASLLPPHHIVVASADCLAESLSELIDKGEIGQGSSIVFVSGPSRTADIEKELVIGVHGPLTLTVILVS